MFKFYSFILFLLPISVSSQENRDFVKRLRAIHNGGVTYYNADGINFTSQTFNISFNEKDLKFAYKKYGIGNEDVKTKEVALSYNNFNVVKNKKIADSLNQTSSFYFVEDKQKMVTVFCFSYLDNPDREFERIYINLILEDKIPTSAFDEQRIDSIDFVGRKIQLNNSCYWTNVNTVQCPYLGEMNWSMHQTLLSAKKAIQNQIMITGAKRGLKVISKDKVNVLFENTPTTALKIVYGFTGLTNLSVKTAGGKTLTAYYLADKVRENYVSCVMSFWDSDKILESGLPPLLDEVMILTK